MAKQNVAEQETLGEAMNKTELFFERNGRTMSYVFLGLLVLAALVFGYRSLILQPRAPKAAEMIAEAQNRFEHRHERVTRGAAGRFVAPPCIRYCDAITVHSYSHEPDKIHYPPVRSDCIGPNTATTQQLNT